MMKTQRLGLIAALIYFSSIALPRSSYAESVSGSWIGIENIYAFTADFGPFQFSSVPAILSVDFNFETFRGPGCRPRLRGDVHTTTRNR